MDSYKSSPFFYTRRCNACKNSIGQGEEKDKPDNVRSTTVVAYILIERGGDMPDFDMRRIVELLIYLLAEQENVDIDYEIITKSKEKAG